MNSHVSCSPSSFTVHLQPCGGIRTRVNVDRCMSWFRRDSAESEKLPKLENGERRVRTEGLWEKCEGCRQIIWKKDLDANLNVCPKCQYHFRLDARTRLATLLDNSEWEETETNLSSTEPLKFVDTKAYKDRLAKAQK